MSELFQRLSSYTSYYKLPPKFELQLLPINKMQNIENKDEGSVESKFPRLSMKEQIKKQPWLQGKKPLFPLAIKKPWSQLINQNYLTVDKSLFIKAVIDVEQSNILITRPRFWGKSMNMNMLKSFLEMQIDSEGKIISEPIFIESKPVCSNENQQREENRLKEQERKNKRWEFENLKITQDIEFVKKHYKKYVVLNLNFNFNFKDSQITPASVRKAIAIQILRFLKVHYYLKDKQDLFDRLFQNLNKFEGEDNIYIQQCKAIKDFFRRSHKAQIIMLIDQYDSVYNNFIVEENMNAENIEKIKNISSVITNFIQGMSSSCRRTVVTGIRNLFELSLYSASNIFLNDSLYCPQLDFHIYFGFNEEETKSLINLIFKSETQSHKKKVSSCLPTISLLRIITNESTYKIVQKLKDKLERGALLDYLNRYPWLTKEERNEFSNRSKMLFEELYTLKALSRQEIFQRFSEGDATILLHLIEQANSQICPEKEFA